MILFGLRSIVLRRSLSVFCLLHKKTFQDFLDKGEIPNMFLLVLLVSARLQWQRHSVMNLEFDVYVINGSDEGRFLDTVRNNAKNFASTVSLTATAKHKVIIIDEADNTSNDVQLCLRAFIEEFAGNCRFIFTCNYKIKSLNPCTRDVPLLSLESKEKTDNPLPPSSSSDSKKSWMQKVLNMITRSW